MGSKESYRAICSRATLQNNKQGCFFDVVDKLVCRIDVAEFSKCNTDYGRIKYCITQCWDFIGVELIFRGKDSDEGLLRKNEGNAAFERGDFNAALLAYNQSIIRTPIENISYIFSNRSALLYKMKEWELCIEDIQLALTYNYSEEKRHILYERMTSAYIQLKKYDKARITLGITRQYLNKFKLNEQLIKKIAKLEKLIQPGLNSNEKSETSLLQIVNSTMALTSRSHMFPNASNKFSVELTKEAGRSAIALEKIQAGELILSEIPFASTIIPERNGSHCHECLKKLRAPVPCETCAHVAFCSRVCRDRAKIYHQYECRVYLLLIGSGMSVLPLLALRLVTKQRLSSLVQDFEKLKLDPESIFVNNTTEKYEGESYKTVYNLVGLENEREPLDFLQRTLMALFLLKCLRLVGYFDTNLYKNPLPTDTELKIGSILLRNLQVLQFNAYEITECFLPPTTPYSKLRTIPVGLGVYTTASFLNHSCAPNVTRFFDGCKLNVVSMEPIEKGIEITDNYGPIFIKMERDKRLKTLEGRYWFDCKCRACNLNNINWTMLQNIADKQEEPENEKILREIYFDPAIKLMEERKGKDACNLLVKFLNLSSPILDGNLNKVFYLAQEAFKLSVSTTTRVNYNAIIRFLRCE